MTALLVTINEYIWFIDLIILAAFFGVFTFEKKINSNLLIWLIVAVLGGTIKGFEQFVSNITVPTTSIAVLLRWCIGFLLVDIALVIVSLLAFKQLHSKIDKRWACCMLGYCLIQIGWLVWEQYQQLYTGMSPLEYKNWVRAAHFLGLATIYLIAMAVIYHSHRILRLRFDFLANMMLLALTSYNILLVTRFMEKVFLETNFLAPLYRWGVVSINASTSIVACVVAIYVVLHYWQYARKQKVLS